MAAELSVTNSICLIKRNLKIKIFGRGGGGGGGDNSTTF